MKTSRSGSFRAVALTLSTIGAIGSLELLFNAGQDTPPLVLVLIAGWILMPYLMFFVVLRISGLWPSTARTSLYVLMIAVPIISVICFSGLLDYPGMRPGFMFVLMPGASCIVVPIALALARRFSHPRS